MACNTWVDKLDAYVDGELPESEASTLATHMRQCANCAADAVDRVQLKRSINLAGRRYEPSLEFRQKIAKSVGAPSTRGSSWAWRIAILPAFLVLLLSLAVGYFVSRERARRDHVYSELADLHVATLASSTPVDVVSTDRHTVKPWFEGKIPFTFNLPELQGTDFTLVGGRLAYLGQTPGAELIYRIRKHEISVFIFQDRGMEMASWAPDATSQFSFTFKTWSQSGLRYFIVGDVGAGDIASLSKLLRDAG